MHLFCADFDNKMEELILVHHYDQFLLNSGGPDSTADRSKKSRLSMFFFTFQLGFSTR